MRLWIRRTLENVRLSSGLSMICATALGEVFNLSWNSSKHIWLSRQLAALKCSYSTGPLIKDLLNALESLERHIESLRKAFKKGLKTA